MQEKRPWLFLDIDGVVIPHGKGSTALENTRVKIQHPELGEIMEFVPNDIIERVQDLTRIYDLVWLSTWGNFAHTLAKTCKIKASHCLVPKTAPDGAPLKAKAMIDFLAREGDRPLVWVDDEIHKYAGGLTSRTTAFDLPWLMVPTDTRKGLTDVHVETLLSFANATISA